MRIKTTTTTTASKDMNVLMVTVMVVMMLCEGARCAATARPLEHSPDKLAWAAWIQQRGSAHHRDVQPEEDQLLPPRRITTKSLFVFPHLGAEALPACAEGYRPDLHGRCVKVVKVDETAHLEFLLQKLNSQFATESSESQEEEIYDYDLDTEAPDMPSGPFQFNIPIAEAVNRPLEDIAEGSGDLVKRDDKNKPTSSPEVVPDYLNFHENATNNVTIVSPSNGKFENVVNDEAKIEKHNHSDPLVDQIESLKSPTTETAARHNDSNSDRFDEHHLNKMNIEDKIKVISKLADVKINDEEVHVEPEDHASLKKKTSNSQDGVVKLSQPNVLYEPPPDAAYAPSTSLVRFPASESTSLEDNYNKKPIFHYDNLEIVPPIEERLPPPPPPHHQQWIPPQWNENDELMKFWSRVGQQQHPYGFQRPPYYQTLYPNESGNNNNNRLNVRHTSVNHRRGRPMFNNEPEYDDAVQQYARNRHQRYRE